MSAVILDWYLFQLIVLLKPDSNCFNSFTLSWVNKVTARTKTFVSVLLTVGSWFAVSATKKQLFNQVNLRLISQLINGISSILQELFLDILMLPLF